MRKLIYWVVLLVFSALILWLPACRKESKYNPDLSEQVSAIQNWLHKYGGAYSNESIRVRSPDGNTIEGRLDWDKANQYIYDGLTYMDAPFIFNDGQTILSGMDKSSVSFTLVVRWNASGNYEGAVRSTIHGNTVSDRSTGEKDIRTTQSYQLFNGTSATFWYENANSTFVEGKKITEA
ncbi:MULTISPECIES: hypothetical protein [Chitinophagaceae]